MNTEHIQFHETELISIHENNDDYLAVKPICEAIGVTFSRQRKVIEDDPILSSTVALRATVGADSKQRKMICLPIRYVYGWLFMIHPGNVKEEARKTIIRYKKECYDVLYEHFYGKADRYKKRDRVILNTQDDIDRLTEERKQMNRDIKEKKAYIKDLLSKPLDQLELPLYEAK